MRPRLARDRVVAVVAVGLGPSVGSLPSTARRRGHLGSDRNRRRWVRRCRRVRDGHPGRVQAGRRQVEVGHVGGREERVRDATCRRMLAVGAVDVVVFPMNCMSSMKIVIVMIVT